MSKDVPGAKDLTEAGAEVSEAGEISVSAGLSRAVVINVSVAFGGEGLQTTQVKGESGQPAKEALFAAPQRIDAAAPQSADVEKVCSWEDFSRRRG